MTRTVAQMPVLCRQQLCGCNGNENNSQLKAETVVVTATATATSSGGSDDNNGAVLEAKGGRWRYLVWTATMRTAARMLDLCQRQSCGYNKDGNNNQLEAETAVAVQ